MSMWGSIFKYVPNEYMGEQIFPFGDLWLEKCI